ncbi:hypothetical protein [Sorangium cellulosum]|uniref:hypothetical protein n=1 Tax=Sorangium cellulosum TaxID=56 RepID=UPI00101360D2|nr:hypothetical protein [Sorangium cellulosum]
MIVVPQTPPVAPKDPLDEGSLPEVEIRGREILLDGKRVGDARNIVELGRLTKRDELFEPLRARRADADQRGAPMQREIAVVADDAAAWIVVESVMRTAAFAGYYRALRHRQGREGHRGRRDRRAGRLAAVPRERAHAGSRGRELRAARVQEAHVSDARRR